MLNSIVTVQHLTNPKMGNKFSQHDQRQHCHDENIEYEDCLPIVALLVDLPPTVII